MDKKVRITPELDEDVYVWLHAEAQKSYRSLQGQVNYSLRECMDRRKAVPVLKPGQITGISKSA